MIKNNNSQENLLNIKKSRVPRLLLLGTGGTIAGLASDSGAYQAAQLSVEALLPTDAGSQYEVKCEQLAQIDSKDMRFDVWEQLYTRIQEAQNDASIDAIVVTHGTDTLEETAFFFSATLDAIKPIILTGAMRPANTADTDGPQNLADALRFAATKHVAVAGVYVAFAGRIFLASRVQKTHCNALDAFEEVGDDSVQVQPKSLKMPIKGWPRIEIVMSYAGASGAIVEALIAQKVDGIVVAGTGNGTIHYALEVALRKAKDAGIAVIITTRCTKGRVITNANHAFEVSKLPPIKARIALILKLINR